MHYMAWHRQNSNHGGFSLNDPMVPGVEFFRGPLSLHLDANDLGFEGISH